MKYSIAICDDARKDRELLRGFLGRWAGERGHGLEISEFSSAESFLFSYAQEGNFHILLLDIEMGAPWTASPWRRSCAVITTWCRLCLSRGIPIISRRSTVSLTTLWETKPRFISATAFPPASSAMRLRFSIRGRSSSREAMRSCWRRREGSIMNCGRHRLSIMQGREGEEPALPWQRRETADLSAVSQRTALWRYSAAFLAKSVFTRSS